MLGAAFRAFAQESKFSTEVKVVTLLATVRDRGGTVITNLNKEDFFVEEDGVPQPILYSCLVRGICGSLRVEWWRKGRLRGRRTPLADGRASGFFS
jgi:hypothetical protein